MPQLAIAMSPLVFSLSLLVTLLAAITDLRSGTIPNTLTLPLLVAAPLAHGLTGGPGALLSALLGIAVCGAVPLWMFLRGAMGGGDVKLLAALGGLLGAMSGLAVQLVAFLVASLLAVVLLARRGQLITVLQGALHLLASPLLPRRLRHRPSTLADASHEQLRLGPAILVASLVVLGRGALP